MNLQATAFWDVITETTLCLNPATVWEREKGLKRTHGTHSVGILQQIEHDHDMHTSGYLCVKLLGQLNSFETFEI
jgi:hypothetical protein